MYHVNQFINKEALISLGLDVLCNYCFYIYVDNTKIQHISKSLIQINRNVDVNVFSGSILFV